MTQVTGHRLPSIGPSTVDRITRRLEHPSHRGKLDFDEFASCIESLGVEGITNEEAAASGFLVSQNQWCRPPQSTLQVSCDQVLGGHWVGRKRIELEDSTKHVPT